MVDSDRPLTREEICTVVFGTQEQADAVQQRISMSDRNGIQGLTIAAVETGIGSLVPGHYNGHGPYYPASMTVTNNRRNA